MSAINLLETYETANWSLRQGDEEVNKRIQQKYTCLNKLQFVYIYFFWISLSFHIFLYLKTTSSWFLKKMQFLALAYSFLESVGQGWYSCALKHKCLSTVYREQKTIATYLENYKARCRHNSLRFLRNAERRRKWTSVPGLTEPANEIYWVKRGQRALSRVGSAQILQELPLNWRDRWFLWGL